MTRFVWDAQKELENFIKHGVDFETAKLAFEDPNRRIRHDPGHSSVEDRFFCVGKIGDKILTVRFTYRGNDIRIIGAGCWRKGKVIYEKKENGSRYAFRQLERSPRLSASASRAGQS